MKKILIASFISLLSCSVPFDSTTTSIEVKAIDEQGNKFSFPENAKLILSNDLNKYEFYLNDNLKDVCVTPGVYNIAIFIDNEIRNIIEVKSKEQILNVYLKKNIVNVVLNENINIEFITEKPINYVFTCSETNCSNSIKSSIATKEYTPGVIKVNCPLGVYYDVKYTPLFSNAYAETFNFNSKVGILYFVSNTSEWSLYANTVFTNAKTVFSDANGHQLTSVVKALNGLSGGFQFRKNSIYAEATSTIGNVTITDLLNNYVDVRMSATLDKDILVNNVLNLEYLSSDFFKAKLDIYIHNNTQLLTSTNESCAFTMIK